LLEMSDQAQSFWPVSKQWQIVADTFGT